MTEGRPRLDGVGIVVIGRNEAPRLNDCLDSLTDWRERLVYVDSGSKDGSPDMAEARGFRVVRLAEPPFSAARGRQAGFEALLAQDANLRYVQFVDGDCMIQPGWIEDGVEFLDRHPAAAVVVGRLRERYAQQSMLSRLVDVDWDLPVGEIDAIGGVAMFRVAALRQVGEWRSELIAGEELDLGTRLRTKGHTLHRLAAEMALHDMGIRSLREWWRRAVRSGFCYTELALLHGRTRVRRWLRRMAGHVAYGAVLPVAALVLAWLWWPGAVAIAALYLLLIARMAWRRLRRGDPANVAVLYALMIVLTKPAGALGTLQFVVQRLRGRPRVLIEYKSPAIVEAR